MDQAARGEAALKRGDFAEALNQYNAAIQISPKAVPYYLKRSIVHQRSSPPNYAAALKDAELAVVFGHERGKRELIGEAQMRRGIALYCLEQYKDAELALSWAEKLNKGEKTLPIWASKVAAKLKTLAEDDEKAKTHIKEIPEVEMLVEANTEDLAERPKVAAPVVTPKEKIRHEWYQNDEFVWFTLYVKGVPEENMAIEFHENSVRKMLCSIDCGCARN